MPLTTTVVKASGRKDASIFFIGEAPGAAEDAQCEPFVGTSGVFLNRVFGAKGIIRSEVLLGNVFNQRPPKNNVDYFYRDTGKKYLTWEGQQHIDKLCAFLEHRLAERKASGQGINLLVAMGAEALKHLTGHKRINKWRGSVLPCTLVPGFKVYVTYHPSYVMRLINEPTERLMGERKINAQNVLPLFEIDFDRIKFQSESSELNTPRRLYKINPTLSEIITKLRQLAEEPFVSCDIETFPGDGSPVLWCIGFSSSPDEAFTIPFIIGGKFAWSLRDEASILFWISKLFLSPAIKIFQGGMYDLAVLGKNYGLRCAKGTYGDTMYCHHASYPYLRKALYVLCSIYTWEPFYKDEGKVTLGKRNDQAEFRYNGKDCCTTREIYPITVRNAKELGTYDGYLRSLSILPSHLGMTLRGVLIDQEKQKTLARTFNEKAQKAQEFLFSKIGFKVNFNSSAQKRKLLYGFLGLEIQFNSKTKKPTTDRDAINKLKQKYPKHPILSVLLEYQKYSKLSSTYTNMRCGTDGRMHTSYSLISTWRMNSTASPFGGNKKEDKEGGNLQNIPKRGEEGSLIRSIFIPDEGKVLLASDRVQAEAMVVAWLSRDGEKMEFFRQGGDIHWLSAKRLFGLPDGLVFDKNKRCGNSITGAEHTHAEYRTIGKTVVHGSNYGLGPGKQQQILSLQGFAIDLATSKRLTNAQRANNPLLMDWQRKIKEEVQATRTLVSPIGRKRQFLGRMNANFFNAAYAFKPQNTIGELTEITIQRIWEELDYAEILLNVHDEVVLQCFPEDIPRAIVDIKRLSSYPIEIEGQTLDIPVSFAVGDNWGELKEIKV